MITSETDNAQAHRLEEENERLRRAVDELSILNELAIAIGAINNSEEVIRKIISRSER